MINDINQFTEAINFLISLYICSYLDTNNSIIIDTIHKVNVCFCLITVLVQINKIVIKVTKNNIISVFCLQIFLWKQKVSLYFEYYLTVKLRCISWYIYDLSKISINCYRKHYDQILQIIMNVVMRPFYYEVWVLVYFKIKTCTFNIAWISYNSHSLVLSDRNAINLFLSFK